MTTVHKDQIDYWKAVDLLKINNDQLKNAEPVFLVTERMMWGQQSGEYEVAAVFYGHRGFQVITGRYSKKEVDNFHYYRLTGALDESDYDSVEQETTEVNRVVLAQREDMVLRYAGYWPTYDSSGKRAWHWIGNGPAIELIQDEDQVIAFYLNQELDEVEDILTLVDDNYRPRSKAGQEDQPVGYRHRKETLSDN